MYVNSQSGISKEPPALENVDMNSNIPMIMGGHCKGNPAARLTICKKFKMIFLMASLASSTPPSSLMVITTNTDEPNNNITKPKTSKERFVVALGHC